MTVEDQILDVLRDADDWLTYRNISDQLGCSNDAVSKAMRRLNEKDAPIKRREITGKYRTYLQFSICDDTKANKRNPKTLMRTLITKPWTGKNRGDFRV